MAAVGLIALRECANLLPEAAAWRAYLTTNEVLLSLLCLLMPCADWAWACAWSS